MIDWGPPLCAACGGDLSPRIGGGEEVVDLRCASCGRGDVLRPGPAGLEALRLAIERRARWEETGAAIRPVVALWLPRGEGAPPAYLDAAVMVRERLVRDDPGVMLIEEPFPDSPGDPVAGPLALADHSLLVAPDLSSCHAACALLGRAVSASRALVFVTGIEPDDAPRHARVRVLAAKETEPGGLFDALASRLAGIRREALYRSIHPGPPPARQEIETGTDELALCLLVLIRKLVSPARSPVLREFGGVEAAGRCLDALRAIRAIDVVRDRVSLTPKGHDLLAGEAARDRRAVDRSALGRLIDEARRGNQEALGRLLRIGGEEARRIAHGRIGSRLRAKVDTTDITQSVMGEILAGLDRFEFLGERAWRGYLRRLVLNKIRAKADYFGAARRDYRREEALPDEGGRTRAPGPPDALLEKEEFERLEASLARLGEDERSVILLRIFEGLTHREIARRLGRPSEGSVHKLYARALNRLAKVMGRNS